MAVKFHQENFKKLATPVRDADASLFEERWQAELKAAEYGMVHGSFSVEARREDDSNR